MLLIGYACDYRPDGLLGEVKESGTEGERKITFGYDHLGRLDAVTDSKQGKYRYAYDAFSNRTALTGPDGRTVASASDWAGRLLTLDDQPCAHDAAGNLTRYPGRQGPVELTHNLDGQLATARTESGMVSYDYDGEGRLVRRSRDGAGTTFVPDPMAAAWQPLLATNGDGKKTFYLWHAGRPLAAVTDGQVQFFLLNHLGSVRGIADVTGKVEQRLDYDPFGVPQGQTAAGLQPGFAALLYDGDAGIYVTGCRAYDPGLGRFLQRDPEHRVPRGNAEDLSAYSYCGADPVNWSDTSGAAREPTNPQGDSGLSVVPRPGMGSETVTDRNGRPVTIYGQSGQASSTTPGHGPMMQNIGESWAHSGEYDYVLYQRSVRTATGRVGTSTNQPDLIGVRRDGKVDMIEVRSKTDSMQQLQQRLTDAQNSLPADRRGKTGIVTPQPHTSSPKPYPTGNVGGIKLGGVGNSLADLGPLKGVALDANGRLVLLTADKGEVDLPPLNLDDVVVIFRAAYRQGEAPYVSIDPDKKDSHAATMDIRHSPGTEDTYVGWVLFEADRVMKAHSLGQDNETNQKIQSRIDGYASTVTRAFDDPERDKGKDLWARFGIVPASVTRRQGRKERLTLLDVPLKVDTEVVIPKEGKLESVPGAKSNPSDEAFARWFSDHYADLSREVWSTPPEGTGRKGRVPVFAELQRIALIAAIAEQLRDQNVPLPSWMRDYRVEPFPMLRTTKTLRVEEKRRQGDVTRTRSVFGGAVMSPPPSAVRTVPSPEADALAPALWKALASAPSLTPVRFEHQGETSHAVALPGDDTHDLGANHIEEADLAVALPNGDEVRLVRSFDSFHQPDDGLGLAWTLDLPKLDVQERRSPGEGKKVKIHRAYQLSSPLGTWSEMFGERKELNVPGVPAGLVAVPRTSRDMLAAWTNRDNQHVVKFRDGRKWTFDKDGWLIAQSRAPLTLTYQRDSQHRVTRIEGRVGVARCHIDLRYDDRGRLLEAVGSDGWKVDYRYDAAGLLAAVHRPDGLLEYRYRDSLVIEERRDGKSQRQFDYAEGGRLRTAVRGDTGRVAYQVTGIPGRGTRLTLTPTDHPEQVETVTFDAHYRPLSVAAADGTRAEWRYENTGAVTFTLVEPGCKPLTVLVSADGRREEILLPSGVQYARNFDEGGRPTELLRDGQTLQRVEWRSDGQPLLVEKEGQAYRVQGFTPNGVPTSVLITALGSRTAITTG